MTPLVLVDWQHPVAIVTLNRPERHNSLVPELLEDLLRALEDVRQRAGLRAVVLQANGASFSTGGDVRQFYVNRARVPGYAHELVGLLNRAILTLVDFAVPVVVAVHGIVTGGSIGLVLGSDIVLVAPEASFTPYYSMVGFSPDGGWTALLPDIIGRQRVSAVLALNETITAEDAVAWGLAHRIVPSDRIREAALEMAEVLVQRAPGSLRHSKRLLRADRSEIAVALEQERRQFVQHVASYEAQHGMVDFLEGRIG